LFNGVLLAALFLNLALAIICQAFAELASAAHLASQPTVTRL